jgi:hypothetical protein
MLTKKGDSGKPFNEQVLTVCMSSGLASKGSSSAVLKVPSARFICLATRGA